MEKRAWDWGIDLGGTKCECVVLDGDEVLLRHRIPTERHGGYQHMLGQIAKLVDECAAKLGQRPALIGMGTPGPGTPDRAAENSNTTEFNGKPLKEDLERRLGVPVLIANDANCFALAETHLGAVRQHHPDAKVVFGIIMGTGVGAGIVINGQILNGHHGIAGEWGTTSCCRRGQSATAASAAASKPSSAARRWRPGTRPGPNAVSRSPRLLRPVPMIMSPGSPWTGCTCCSARPSPT